MASQVGDPAAACNTSKERVRTTGPPVALCRLTTHDDSSSTVSFAYSRQGVLRGVRGIVSPGLWVLGEVVSIRSVFPRPTQRDTVSKHSRHTGVRGGVPFGSLTAFVISCGQISCGFANTQSGGETFHAGPLGVWGRYSRQNQPRGLKRKSVRPAFSGVRGGASMGPLRSRRRCNAGSAAKRMCL